MCVEGMILKNLLDWLCLTSRSSILHSCWELRNVGFARGLCPLSGEGSLSCHPAKTQGLSFCGFIQRNRPISRHLWKVIGTEDLYFSLDPINEKNKGSNPIFGFFFPEHGCEQWFGQWQIFTHYYCCVQGDPFWYFRTFLTFQFCSKITFYN